MKRLLLASAMLLASCQTLPEPSPYDGKCYAAGAGTPVVILLRVVGKTLEGDKYSLQSYQPMTGAYGEGEVPAATVEKDLGSGLLKPVDCPKNDKGEDGFDAIHKEYAEWKAKQVKPIEAPKQD